MNYQITREASEYGGYSVRLQGEFYPYEYLGSTYLGHLRDASDLHGKGMWHYVPVIRERQLPGIYVHNDSLEEFLHHIASMTDEQSRREYKAAQEALEWAHIIQAHEWTVRTANESRAMTTEYSSLNDD